MYRGGVVTYCYTNKAKTCEREAKGWLQRGGYIYIESNKKGDAKGRKTFEISVASSIGESDNSIGGKHCLSAPSRP